MRLLALILAFSASAASACEVPPHTLSQMPETVVFGHDGADITAVWFDAPTSRYPHGALGDDIEGGALMAYASSAMNDCGTLYVMLDPAHVFEDEAPRLADMNGDGTLEIIVVRSHETQGAQLTVYDDAGDGSMLQMVAATPYIGQRNRWLAPIGAADLDGDGMMEIAYIDRPHLARILRVWRYVPNPDGRPELIEIASAPGLTNHELGWPGIPGGIRDCGDGPEMITANADWTAVMATRLLRDGTLESRSLGRWTAGALDANLICP